MPTYRFENYTINAHDRLLLRNGTRVDIWPKAADVLLLLVAARGEVVPKERFMETLWPDADVGEATLTANIHHLRKAFNGDAPGGFIETLPRRGYRVSVPVDSTDDVSAADGRGALGSNARAAHGVPKAPWGRGVVRRWLSLGRAWPGLTVAAVLTAAVSSAILMSARKDQAPPPLTLGAIRSYELGRYYFEKNDEPSDHDLRAGISHFERLTQQAPGFSDGFALLAEDDVELAFSMEAVRDAPQLETQAAVSANRAALLNPRDPETLTALAAVDAYVNGKPKVAEGELARALALAPDELTPNFWNCWLSFDEGHLASARHACQTVLAMEPRWSGIATLIAWTYYLSRDYPDAIAYNRQLLQSRHRNVSAMFGLALSFELSGDFGHAVPMIRRMMRQLDKQPGGAWIGRAMLADAYARMGRRQLAERLLREIDLSRVDARDNTASISIASLFTTLGRKADAIAWLARLSPTGRHIYEDDPRLDSLRRDPRFTAWQKA